MRLRRLDLVRYGRFTDHRLDFGPHTPGQPDLHILFGRNEAGKSTTQSAWLDLLFGIPAQSGFNFLHSYDTMRIAALLETSDGPLEIARVKRRSDTLLGADDRPIPPTRLLAELGGLSRDSYRDMFCLDDETLQKGGEDILQSRGELGQLLFQASSGLADLDRTLRQLREEAESFTGRSGRLAEMTRQLEDLKRQLSEQDINAPRWRALSDEASRATGAHRAARAARDATRRELDRITLQIAARAPLQDWQHAQAQIAALGDLPEPPADWASSMQALLADEVELVTLQTRLDADLSRTQSALDAIEIETAALALADQLAGLERLRARFRTAAIDIPQRRQEYDAIRPEIDALLRRIGQDGAADPAALLLTTAQTARLSQLIARRSGIIAALTQAQTEHNAAQATHAAALAACGTDPEEADAALLRLNMALEALRRTDHNAQLRRLTQAREAAQAPRDDAFAALRPWQGTAQSLAEMTVPDDAQVNAWIAAHDAAARAQDLARAQCCEARQEQARLDAARTALATLLDGLDQEGTATIRRLRNEAWALHRRTLTAGSADRFEDAMQRDDAAMTVLLTQQAQLAQLHGLTADLARRGADVALHEAALAHASLQMQMVTDALAALDGPPPTALPTALRHWLAARQEALRRQQTLDAADLALRHAAQAAEDDAMTLADAMAALGEAPAPDLRPDQLRAAGEALAGRLAARAQLRRQEQTARLALEQRRLALAQAQQAAKRFAADWHAACAPLWFAPLAPQPDEVAALLPELATLATLLRDQAGLARRIAEMAQDQRDFAAALHTLAARLDPPPAASDPSALDAALAQRVAAAQAAHRRREESAQALIALRHQRAELDERRDRHARQRQARLDLFGCATLAEVDAALRRAAERDRHRAVLRKTAAEIERLIELPAAAAVSALAEQSMAALTEARDRLQATLEAQDSALEDSLALSRDASRALAAIGPDDEIARLDARRRVLTLEIEQAVIAYLRLRAGILAAEAGLRRYRDTHRTLMLHHASEAFASITNGAYQRLATQRDKDSEMLVALDAEGRSKRAADMSKGTRFQLYLSLRAAGFRALASPVPFIADDIFETFDNERARAAMRVLHEMSRAGQVICLTHHEHLCDIARACQPDIAIHELG